MAEHCCIQIITRARDYHRERAKVFRAQNEPTHAFTHDCIAVALSAVLSDIEAVTHG